jgi:folylpolyglutamate synthase
VVAEDWISGIRLPNQAIRKAALILSEQPDDFKSLNIIHIAGTKGKGSTSAFISSILSQYIGEKPGSGTQATIQKIGLYTSPHLRFVRERIQINNRPLSEEEFARYFFETWDLLEAAAKAAGQDPATKPVYFRFLTLMAFHTYKREGVDAAVIECGIGGEYDSTNIITKPVVTGITNLGIDHTGLLGSSIEEIAWHKAGIMKNAARCFTVPQKEGALKVLQDRAREKDVKLDVVPVHPELQSDSVAIGLSASFQKSNASLAIAISKHFLTQYGFQNITTSPLSQTFKKGLQDVRWGGRCETRHEDGITWCIDGGHTLESITLVGKWFAEHLASQRRDPNGTQMHDRPLNRVLIFNQQTRDANALARALHAALAQALADQRPFTHAIFCTNTTFRETGFQPDLISINTDAEEVRKLTVQKGLARAWEELDPETEVRVVGTIEEAVGIVRTLRKDGEEGGGGLVTALVTGSLHLVGGLLEVLESGSGSQN